MTTMQTPRVRIKNVCTSPDAGELLVAYVVDELDDAEAETVEIHLNECPRCKELYLIMLEARSQAPERFAELLENNQDTATADPASVEPAETLTPSIRRKGKASGSLI